ncbi:MbeD/MobD family mobilization/exclusion protein [Desulfosporosinus sp. SB140]|uniref:MbeD/MobD family mobilization/exclusion protein n=1 Tax=Desulfosporosinus paludis TaxID=3115649 RepID=UPI00388E4F38
MEDKILQAIEGLKEDSTRRFDALTSQVNTLTSQMNTLTNQVNTLANQGDTLTNQVNTLTNQVNENTQILKALEHLAQVNRAERDRMIMDIAEIHGEVRAIRKDLSTVELVTANNWSDIAKLKSIK